MTSNTTTETVTATGELRHLNPADLVIDTNIRTEAEATLTAEFVDSIRDGVRRVLDDPSYARAARSAADGAHRVADPVLVCEAYR